MAGRHARRRRQCDTGCGFDQPQAGIAPRRAEALSAPVVDDRPGGVMRAASLIGHRRR